LLIEPNLWTENDDRPSDTVGVVKIRNSNADRAIKDFASTDSASYLFLAHEADVAT